MARTQFHTKATLIGRSTELHVLAELTFLGIPAFATEHPYTKADIIVEMGGVLRSIQVKTLCYRERDKLYRCTVARNDRKGSNDYSEGIDFFVLYAREEAAYFVVPAREAEGLTEFSWMPPRLRVKATNSHRKCDLNPFLGAWHLLAEGCDVDDWQRARLGLDGSGV